MRLLHKCQDLSSDSPTHTLKKKKDYKGSYVSVTLDWGNNQDKHIPRAHWPDNVINQWALSSQKDPASKNKPPDPDLWLPHTYAHMHTHTCICSLNPYGHANIHATSIQKDKIKELKTLKNNIEEKPRSQEIVTGRKQRIPVSDCHCASSLTFTPSLRWHRNLFSTLDLRFLTFFSMCSSFFKGLSCMHNVSFHLRKVFLMSVLLPSSRTIQSSDR